MVSEKYKDVYAGIFILVVGAVLLAASFRVPSGAAVTIGSDFMPKVICGFMTVLGVVITRNGIRNSKICQEEKGEPGRYRDLLLSVLCLVIYMWLLVPIGFIIMTTLYITAQAYILAPDKKKQMGMFFLIGAVLSVVIYFIFRHVFVLMLPAGVVGFLG